LTEEEEDELYSCGIETQIMHRASDNKYIVIVEGKIKHIPNNPRMKLYVELTTLEQMK
jgi:hypothetical protein